jgi:GNAT superfamily N-acetyltransferase
MTEPVIRSAQQDDLREVLELYRHLHPTDPRPDAERAEGAWSALLSSGFNTVLVAEVAGVLVASCTLSVIPNLTRSARPYGVIENVVTHSEHRRTGLGRAVLAAALDLAWNANCYKVMLASGRDAEILRFYDQMGFKRGGKTFFEIRRL